MRNGKRAMLTVSCVQHFSCVNFAVKETCVCAEGRLFDLILSGSSHRDQLHRLTHSGSDYRDQPLVAEFFPGQAIEINLSDFSPPRVKLQRSTSQNRGQAIESNPSDSFFPGQERLQRSTFQIQSPYRDQPLRLFFLVKRLQRSTSQIQSRYRDQPLRLFFSWSREAIEINLSD